MIGASKAGTTRAYQLLNTGTITSTGSQTYTIPAGTLYLEIEVWGGGGGGGAGGTSSGRSGTAYQGGGGGGGGAYCKHKYQPSDMQVSDTLNFTVGAGGAGSQTGAGTNVGADGAATTLDTHKRSASTIASFSVSAGGAEGNLSGFALSFGAKNGDGGTAANGNITNTDGADGTARPGQSGSSVNGTAGGAGANGGAGGAGGTSHDGADGTVPGGGGGGGKSDCTSFCQHSGVGHGGDGADGKVIVKAYG